MASIAALFAQVYRDFKMEGVMSSGLHEPLKSEIREIGAAIEASLSRVQLGGMIGVYKDTRANLNADLAFAADTLALVYADATEANNDIYIKVGASGAGSWTLTTIMHDVIAGAIASEVSSQIDPKVAAAAASALVAERAAEIALNYGPHDFVYLLPGNPGLSGKTFAVVNGEGRLVSALPVSKADDLASLLRLSQSFFLSGDIAFGVVDATGKRLPFSVANSGLTRLQNEPGRALAYVSGSAPNRSLRAKVRQASGAFADILVSVPGNDIESVAPPPAMDRNTVTFWDATAGALDAELLVPPVVPAGVTEVIFVPTYGQSNSSFFDGAPIQSTAPDHPRSVMWVGGQIMGENREFLLGEYAGFTGAYAKLPPNISTQKGESICSGIGYALATRLTSSSLVLCASYGIGGAGISTFIAGTAAYKKLIRAVQRAKVMCDMAGLALKVPAVVWVQGEANVGTGAASYGASYEAMRDAANTAIKAITGQADDVIFTANPVSSWTASGLTSDATQLTAAQKAIDLPAKFSACAPMYYSAFAGTLQLHDNGPSRRERGELTGHAIADKIGGLSKPFCHAISAVRTGSVVQLTFPRAVAFDTSIVSNPGNHGIRFFQTGGNSVSVSSVALNADPTKIDVQLSAIPTGTAQTIGIADLGTVGAGLGRANGPRSTIREAASHATAKSGVALYRYALPQQIAVS